MTVILSSPSASASASARLESLHVGVDENGLGPRLGPLIVTAVTARAGEEGAKVIGKRPRGSLAARLGDSKDLVSFEDSALGAAWAVAMARRAGAEVGSLRTPADVLRALALEDERSLRSACPDHHVDQCWRTEGETIEPAAALVDDVERDLARLSARGVHVTGARVAIVCAKRLNDAVTRGHSRFDADLHAMEQLVASVAHGARAEVVATCGKVGGYDRYGDAFASFLLHTPVVEGRARSEYRVPGVGSVAFVRDAEARHILVAMASLVGKWARDLLMRRIVRYHQESVPDLPEASGYHDPVTTRFIAATALSRKKAKIDDECFVRRAIGAQSRVTSSGSEPAPAPTRASPSASRSPRPS
jgi:ribonuclease HII